VLDCFDSVEQVVDSAREVVIDGWNWHFFAADANGNTAAIEFIAGKPVLTYGEAMPVTVLCNAPYARELDRLQNYEGFGGEKPVILKGDTLVCAPEVEAVDERFVDAATLIKRSADSPMQPTDYALKILEEMAWDGTQWSYVCDLTNKKIRFRTKDSAKVKELSLAAFDFDPHTPTLMLDIHTNRATGPNSFSDYSLEFNRASLAKAIAGWESVFTSNGATLEGALHRISSYSETATSVAGKAH
jgi:penicillin V acylase-like amidase (Ntn superfamily)